MIEARQDGDLLTLVLNRPDKANSLTAVMMQCLIDRVKGAADSGVKALVLTGAGKVFSAGADLDEARAGLATSPLWEELSGTVANLPCLTIAALNGTLAGGAFGMALACDLRIAVPSAKFFYPVMKLGFLPQPSDPGRMRDLVGPARAAMILMAGQKASAEEALNWGLIDRIVEAEVLLPTARTMAEAALAAKPTHITAIKRMIR